MVVTCAALDGVRDEFGERLGCAVGAFPGIRWRNFGTSVGTQDRGWRGKMMDIARDVAAYGIAAWLLTRLRPWRRFWIIGVAIAVWLVFSTKYTLRAVARRAARGGT